MKNNDIARKLCLTLFFTLISIHIFPQNSTEKPIETSSLTAEISRLEKLSLGGTDANTRYDAFLALARLYQLLGNSEDALKSQEAALSVLPGGSIALLEKGRQLISMGEYDKAAEAIAALLTGDREKDVLLQARYLMALLEAFRSGNVRLLSALADEDDFTGFRSRIYYALWNLVENPSGSVQSTWKSRLTREFPKSPETAIAENQAISAQTPLWLLYPGRDSLRLTAQPAAPVTPAAPAAAATQATADMANDGAVLQVGLFSREENARDLADRLKKAGFAPALQQRPVNGVIHWAVIVPGGRDAGAVAKRLKDAGFDSFPVKL